MLLNEIRSVPSDHSVHLQTLKKELEPIVVDRIKKPAGSKAVQDVVRQLYHLFALHDISIAEFERDFRSNSIFDPSVLLTGGDLFSHVNIHYRDLAHELYSVRSTGLGTPNAASGEGELMALMLSPNVSVSKKDKKGDLVVNDKYVELKGWAPRVFAPALGTDLNEKGKELCKKFGLQLGAATKGREVVSPWDSGKREMFWRQQFENIGEPKAKQFLMQLMNATGAPFSEDAISRCWIGGVFHAEQLQREIVKSFFAATPKEWDFLTVIVDGNVQAVSNSNRDFAAAVDSGKILPSGNFFRMFKPIPIAWYYRFSIAPPSAIDEET